MLGAIDVQKVALGDRRRCYQEQALHGKAIRGHHPRVHRSRTGRCSARRQRSPAAGGCWLTGEALVLIEAIFA